MKTLEEIDLIEHNLDEFKNKETLRKEAIKWIKELRKVDFNSIDEKAKFFSGNRTLLIWISTFFNITEDDLDGK